VVAAEPLVRRALALVPLIGIVWIGFVPGVVELSSTIEKVVFVTDALSA